MAIDAGRVGNCTDLPRHRTTGHRNCTASTALANIKTISAGTTVQSGDGSNRQASAVTSAQPARNDSETKALRRNASASVRSGSSRQRANAPVKMPKPRDCASAIDTVPASRAGRSRNPVPRCLCATLS